MADHSVGATGPDNLVDPSSEQLPPLSCRPFPQIKRGIVEVRCLLEHSFLQPLQVGDIVAYFNCYCQMHGWTLKPVVQTASQALDLPADQQAGQMQQLLTSSCQACKFQSRDAACSTAFTDTTYRPPLKSQASKRLGQTYSLCLAASTCRGKWVPDLIPDAKRSRYRSESRNGAAQINEE